MSDTIESVYDKENLFWQSEWWAKLTHCRIPVLKLTKTPQCSPEIPLQWKDSKKTTSLPVLLSKKNFNSNIILPSEFWAKHLEPGQDGSVLYCTSIVNQKMRHVSEKVAMFLRQAAAPYTKVYLRGMLLESRTVRDRLDAKGLMAEVNELHLCSGAIIAKQYSKEYFTAKLKRHAVVILRQQVSHLSTHR